MTDGQSNRSEVTDSQSSVSDWPTFDLQYTFNPERKRSLDPDEVFVFDPDNVAQSDTYWISADRDSYVPIEDVR